MDKLDIKITKNALISERLIALSGEEKHKLIMKLLDEKKCSVRELARDLGLSHTTVNDWKLKRYQMGQGKRWISLDLLYRKVVNLTPDKVTDWGRLEMIKERCEELLRQKPKNDTD